jgi:hypothetical protein
MRSATAHFKRVFVSRFMAMVSRVILLADTTV